jgi:DNA helicase-4
MIGIQKFIISPFRQYMQEVTILEQEWKTFERKDTYFTYREQQNLLKDLTDKKFNVIKLLLCKFFSRNLYRKVLLSQQEAINIRQKINTFNENYIEKRLHEYKSLFDGTDDGLKTPLDHDQRRAVITDDQHNLVVAGAGSGKTSVLTMRIAYLTRRKDSIPPKRILALAYTKKAAEEMQVRLKKQFKITDVEVRTFHSFAFNIIKEHFGKVPYDVKSMEDIIDELFLPIINNNYQLQQLFIEYLSNYLQKEPKETDFQSKEEFYNYLKNQRYLTLSGIEVKSIAERDIANFLFTHNIKFEYEKLARWASHLDRSYHPDFYLPEYDIYIEHWGVNRQGQVASWFTKTSQEYLQERNWKLSVFEKHHKILVQTWDYERVEGNLVGSLKERLQEINKNITFTPLSYKELVEKVFDLQNDKNQAIKDLIKGVITYCISNFMTPAMLKTRIQQGIFSEKSGKFGKIALLFFEEIVSHLSQNDIMDYDRMINEAIDIIGGNPQKYINRYNHILVDEFQDISNQRLQLLKWFVNNDSQTKLFCVGDDWQSIYKFAGSEVTFFINFQNYFSHPAITNLGKNYRSAEKIVTMSNSLIAHNKKQRKKSITANNTTEAEIMLLKINKNESNYSYNNIQKEQVFQQITYLIDNNVPPEEIMVLSRFNKAQYYVRRLLDDTHDERYKKVQCLSVHRAKGKEATYVFLLGVVSGALGFPSEIEDDSVLEIVKKLEAKESIFEEERRLFYVALTRSKQFLYIFTQEGKESHFLNEIKNYTKEFNII